MRKRVKKIFYIDTENVPYWEVSVKARRGDFVYFFTTENSRQLNEESLKRVRKNHANYEIITCRVGRNALDFQLSTTLGYVLKENQDKKHIVVSCDEGYAAVIDFWKDRGFLISRIKDEKSKKKEEYKKFVYSMMEHKAFKGNMIQKELKRLNVSQDEVKKIQEIVVSTNGKNNYLGLIHNELVSEFGVDKGLALFNNLKNCDAKIV